jgi:3-deoxy-D-manno-octulosonate 8-phosphate phosphatase (KDO 8-P phosphatase)
MIKLIVLDVDGTLTNGQITYDTNGMESKSFDVKDGMAISSWSKALKLNVAIITGRNSIIVEKRAKELGVSHLYQNIDKKKEKIDEILKELNLTWQNVACIGDDFNDYTMLKKAKLSFCPNDAIEDIKSIVNVICSKNGGAGAVREMIEYILAYDDNKDAIRNLWV